MKRIFLAVVVLAAVALLGFACGDDDDDNGGGDDGGNTVAATTAGTNGGGGEKTFDVEASNFKFTPGEFEVSQGDAVTFNYTNNSGTPHTFTVYTDEAYTDQVDEAGGSGVTTDAITVTFDNAQDYYFRCEIHPGQMKGEIKVG